VIFKYSPLCVWFYTDFNIEGVFCKIIGPKLFFSSKFIKICSK
jgi:hypothetical protein